MANLTINGEINFTTLGAEAKATLLALLYPIGHIITVRNNNDYTNYLGGLWQKLPAGKVLWSADSVRTIAEDTIEAGLPNITGYVNNAMADQAKNNYGGVFNVWQGGKGHPGGNYYWSSFNFDASRSNSIYGKSSTVQPPAIKAVMWQRIG